MASLEVLNTTDDSESLPYDDYSFLSEISVSNTQVKEVNQLNNGTFNFTNMQSALSTEPSDSSIEIHSQINKLIEENNLLKEKLNKTNHLMEENFEKAKEKISVLENENSELRLEVASLKMNQNQKKTPCEKCTILETGLTNMLGVDYMEENQDLILEWSYFRENLYGNLQYICKQLEDISKSKGSSEEKVTLDCYILMLKFKMAFMDGSGDIIQFASLRTDEETGFEVVRLKREGNPQQLNLVIEDLIKALKRRDEQLITLRTERENFVEKINAYELKIHECELALKSQNEFAVPPQYKEICKTLEKENKKLQNSEESSSSMSNDHSVEKLKDNIQNLKEILKLEQQTNKKDKEKLLEVMTKCEKLQVDYDRVTRLLEIQSKDEKEKKKELALKEKSFKEEVDRLTAELKNVQDIVDKKDAELKILQEKFSKEESRKPDVSRHQSNSNQKNENGKADENILCPICGIRLADERFAQKHVNRCLDKK